jgi:FAD synthetase
MKVLASGVFDLLHYGHIRFLEEAKKLGGPDAKLIVIVASDETVTRAKGRPPVIPEDQRRAVIESLKVVDEAILGYRDQDLDKVVNKVQPDIVAVGHDQHEIEEEVKRLIALKGYKTRVKKIGRFGPEDLNSSSKIKRRISEGSGKRL